MSLRNNGSKRKKTLASSACLKFNELHWWSSIWIVSDANMSFYCVALLKMSCIQPKNVKFFLDDLLLFSFDKTD